MLLYIKAVLNYQRLGSRWAPFFISNLYSLVLSQWYNIVVDDIQVKDLYEFYKSFDLAIQWMEFRRERKCRLIRTLRNTMLEP